MPKRSHTRHIVLCLLGAATLLAASPASAATPAVSSIELTPGVDSTLVPTGILPNSGPNASFFLAGTASGSGVWRTDGTQAGTSRVATTHAGYETLIRGPVLSGNLAVFAPFFFSPAFDTVPAPDVLYVTDGTAAGTKTFAVPARPANTYSVTWRSIGAVGNRAVFSRRTTTSITDVGTTTLIRTDGTAAGTVQLSLGAATDASAEGTLHDGKLYFVAGSSLRRTDGTTVEVVDAANQGGGVLHACGTTLFYSIGTYTDAATTWRLRAIVGGSTVTLVESAEKPYHLTSAACIGNKLLFSRTTPDAGLEPWISDGTASGTKLLKDILPGPTGSRTGGDLAMASINGVAVFQADDVDPARPTIWATDGTPGGTRKLGAHGTTAGRWFATGIIGRRLYLGKSGASEILWTDGATTSVIPLGGKPWPAPNARWMTSGSRLFGFGSSPATGNEPWMLDDPDALLPAPTPPAPTPDGGPGDDPGRVSGADAGATGSSGGSRGGDPEADAADSGESGGCAVRARRSPVTERFAALAGAVAMVLAVARRRRRA